MFSAETQNEVNENRRLQSVIMVGCVDDDIWAKPKMVCDRSGLDWLSQYKMLVSAAEEQGWAAIKKILTVARDGKNREQMMIRDRSC